jgi:hypothetical protein
MAQGDTDLRSLLDADRQIVMDILDTSYKLIVDVGAHSYWTQHALEICSKLVSIGNNLGKLLDLSGTYWKEGRGAFAHAEPLKLWNTAVGLFRALQPEKAKFVEQLAKRRRLRIMAQEPEESDLTDPAVAAAEKERFKEEYAKLVAQYAALNERIREVPAGMAPPQDAAMPPLNGKQDGVAPGAAAMSPAPPQGPAAPPPPELGNDPLAG